MASRRNEASCSRARAGTITSSIRAYPPSQTAAPKMWVERTIQVMIGSMVSETSCTRLPALERRSYGAARLTQRPRLASTPVRRACNDERADGVSPDELARSEGEPPWLLLLLHPVTPRPTGRLP